MFKCIKFQPTKNWIRNFLKKKPFNFWYVQKCKKFFYLNQLHVNFFIKEGNIDVSLLHCGLNTENQIAEEEDVIWEWTKLFTEVVSVLTVTNEAEFNEEPVADDQRLKPKPDSFNVSTKRERDIIF